MVQIRCGVSGGKILEFCGTTFRFISTQWDYLVFSLLRFFLILSLWELKLPWLCSTRLIFFDLVFRRVSLKVGHIERRKNRAWSNMPGKKPAIRKQSNHRIFLRLRLRRRVEWYKICWKMGWLPEMNLVPHNTTQAFYTCVVLVLVFQNDNQALVCSCARLVPVFKKTCVQGLYFDRNEWNSVNFAVFTSENLKK